MESYKDNMNEDEFWFINFDKEKQDTRENKEKAQVEESKGPVKEDRKESEKMETKIMSDKNRNKINELLDNINSFDVSDPSDEEPLFGDQDEIASDGWKVSTKEENSPELNKFQEQVKIDDESSSGPLPNVLGGLGGAVFEALTSSSLSMILLMILFSAKLTYMLHL